MPHRQVLGEKTGPAALRVTGACLAVASSILHVGAGIYWFAVGTHLVSALASSILGGLCALAVIGCLRARSAAVAGAVGALLAISTIILTVLYGV